MTLPICHGQFSFDGVADATEKWETLGPGLPLHPVRKKSPTRQLRAGGWALFQIGAHQFDQFFGQFRSDAFPGYAGYMQPQMIFQHLGH